MQTFREYLGDRFPPGTYRSTFVNFGWFPSSFLYRSDDGIPTGVTHITVFTRNEGEPIEEHCFTRPEGWEEEVEFTPTES